MNVKSALELLEDKASELSSECLAEYFQIADAAIAVADACLTAASNLRPAASPAVRSAGTVLLTRLANDLRAVVLLCMRGYWLQAASITASMHEASNTLVMIGDDEQCAHDWLMHKNNKWFFLSPKKTVNVLCERYHVGMTPEQAHKIYEQLCLPKHSNPDFMLRYTRYTKDGQSHATIGPIFEDFAMHNCRTTLAQSISTIIPAISAFALGNLPAPEAVPVIAKDVESLLVRLERQEDLARQLKESSTEPQVPASANSSEEGGGDASGGANSKAQ